jgi:hypothetical protein
MANEVAPYSNNISGIILRVKETHGSLEVGNSDTQSYKVSYLTQTSSLALTLLENIALKDMVRNLWSVYLYNQEYIAFLLGSYTKEQFKQIAKNYAQPFCNTIDKPYLFVASKTAFEVLNQNLTSSDLSLLLNIDTNIVEKKMTEIGYNKLDDSEDD